MPYIKQENREKFIVPDGHQTDSLKFIGSNCQSSGELNYVFSKIALEYLKHKGVNYQAFNDIIGALEGAKLELYRIHCAPYEDVKIYENGHI